MQRLKFLRERNRVNQNELAKAIGISPSNISKYELGSLEPNVKVLIALSSYFDVSIDYLLGNSNEPDKANTAIDGDSSFIYICSDNNNGYKVDIPSEQLQRFKTLLMAGMPDVFKDM